MKLISLSINNIASIPSAFIDFTAEPLASAPVYLISGNTGAGKSTILDSICLALYANTPRLQRLAEAGHKSVETEDGNKYTDSRAMARLDAVQASAELCFIGNDGVRYKATWATARPYKKADRPFRAHTHTLEFTVNGNTTVLEKVAQVREQVERAVGLDFKKFCRTTMLAQG
nr:SMC family ATPase [Muribaculaceae bacterium]